MTKDYMSANHPPNREFTHQDLSPRNSRSWQTKPVVEISRSTKNKNNAKKKNKKKSHSAGKIPASILRWRLYFRWGHYRSSCHHVHNKNEDYRLKYALIFNLNEFHRTKSRSNLPFFELGFFNFSPPKLRAVYVSGHNVNCWMFRDKNVNII